jgi:hypothetical protein
MEPLHEEPLLEPIRNLKDYMKYRSILREVNDLILYYDEWKDDTHDHTPRIQIAKRKLLKTKKPYLFGENGRKINIDNASDQKVNSDFRKAFSKPKEGLGMPEYLKTKTKDWYEKRIKDFEESLKDFLPEIAPTHSLIAAEFIAKEKHHEDRADLLHQTLEQRLSKCSQPELESIWQTYFPQSDIRSLLKSYSAFDNNHYS